MKLMHFTAVMHARSHSLTLSLSSLTLADAEIPALSTHPHIAQKKLWEKNEVPPALGSVPPRWKHSAAAAAAVP